MIYCNVEANISRDLELLKRGVDWKEWLMQVLHAKECYRLPHTKESYAKMRTIHITGRTPVESWNTNFCDLDFT